MTEAPQERTPESGASLPVEEPSFYIRERRHAWWYYWLVPSRHDPRNATLAAWALPVALLEWPLFFMLSLFAPESVHGAPPSVVFRYLVLNGVLLGLLACFGWRAMTSGHVHRLGGLLLFWANLVLFLLLSLGLLLQWLKYRD